MKVSFKNFIFGSIAIVTGALFLTACNTFEGTVRGATKDINVLTSSISDSSHQVVHKKAVSSKGTAVKSSVKTKATQSVSSPAKTSDTSKVQTTNSSQSIPHSSTVTDPASSVTGSMSNSGSATQ